MLPLLFPRTTNTPQKNPKNQFPLKKPPKKAGNPMLTMQKRLRWKRKRSN